MVTAGLPGIVCGVFDGDADALFALLADRGIDEFVRHSLFCAAVFRTWEGSIPAERMHGFLQRFYDERLASDYDYAWIGWLEAIAWLGLRDLAPLVYRAWDDDRIDDSMITSSEFEGDLVEAEAAPRDAARLKRARLGYIDDIVEALEWTDRPDQPAYDGAPAGWSDRSAMPVTNPWRGVGRNDPCPCGSGKKAKHCHLA